MELMRTLQIKRTRPIPASRGMTLIEVLIALFIFLVGIVGLLAAMPTGVNTAEKVIFQDAAIHLSRSKFAEIRRDRIDPRVDLLDGSNYMDPPSPPRHHEPVNGSLQKWRDFAHGPGDTYENFDEIERYQWRIDPVALNNVGTDVGNNYVPKVNGGTDVGLTRVVIIIGLKGTKIEYRFTQYICAYGN
jgi:prepilin-type N-terminal cleavage/methylation domain-containing protein